MSPEAPPGLLGRPHPLAEMAGRLPSASPRLIGWVCRRPRLATLAPVFMLLVLACANLEHYPRTWFDEGVLLEAAKTLAVDGQYGLTSGTAVLPFDPIVTTGPTVIGPAALAFKVLGVGLWQARLVAVGYLLVAALGLYLVGRLLYGPTVAGFTVLFFVAAGPAGPFLNGRALLGEVPGVAFLALGGGALATGRRSGGAAWFALSGLALGLALLTKVQFWLVAPALVLLWLYARWSRSGPTGRQVAALALGLVGPPIAWAGLQIALLGPALFFEQQRLALSLATSHPGARAISFARAGAALDAWLADPVAVWGAAGLIYLWGLALTGPADRSYERLLLPLVATVWLGWFLLLSVGWARYAVPAVLLGALFAGKLAADLLAALRGAVGGGSRPVRLGLLALVGGTLLAGLVGNGAAIVRARDDSPQRFAALVAQQVPPGESMAVADLSIAFLAGRPSVGLTQDEVLDAIRLVFLGGSAPAGGAARVPPEVRYLVVGPFSRLAHLYESDLGGDAFERIGGVGEFELYRRVDLR